MAKPRSELVDPDVPMGYHITSRCVRQSWLCGYDRSTKRNYSHRKNWLVKRIKHLARNFSVEVYAYAVLSNHFHIVVHYDPKECQTWSDEEVAYRWVEVSPPKRNGQFLEHLKPIYRERLLKKPNELKKRRAQLGSLSEFMKKLKWPIAWRANREDGKEGHFFEQRFYSGALLSDAAVLAAMAYVDLNPVRAKIARRLRECKHTAIQERMKQYENTPERLNKALEPLVSGLTNPTQRFALTLEKYIELLEDLIRVDRQTDETRGERSKITQWYQRVSSIKKRQWAYGSKNEKECWRATRDKENPTDPAWD